MSLNAPLSFSCPGKVFLLGEYAVLGGQPAIVAATAPRFSLQASGFSNVSASFHPDSPAGRLLAWASAQGYPDISCEFVDPLGGSGGFGASTAQFALLYRALAEKVGLDRDAVAVWRLYRELTGDSALPPSGADLIAQWQGGVQLFDPRSQSCQDISSRLAGSDLLIFSATRQKGRKVATHSHLQKLAGGDLFSEAGVAVGDLSRVFFRGLEAIRGGDWSALGRAFTDYADTLRALELEAPETFADRSALMKQSGVLGVKGAGARQSDAVLVLLDPAIHPAQRTAVLEVAQGRGLEILHDGFKAEGGVRCGS